MAFLRHCSKEVISNRFNQLFHSNGYNRLRPIRLSRACERMQERELICNEESEEIDTRLSYPIREQKRGESFDDTVVYGKKERRSKRRFLSLRKHRSEQLKSKEPNYPMVLQSFDLQRGPVIMA